MRNVIIDVDTGIDDAQALLLALCTPEFNVLGITCVNGNVILDKVTKNTLKVVEHSRKKVKVYVGASQAMIPEKSENAPHIHGSDGLGDLDFPEPSLQIEDEEAVSFIARTLQNSPDPIEIIAIGPLTNIALAIQKYPEIISHVSMLTMMAGGIDFGNTLPMSEFNVFADPESAKIVFDSNLPKIMVPLDPLWHGGQINNEDILQLENEKDKPWCEMMAKLMRRTIEMADGSKRKYAMGEGSVAPPDLLTVALAINPTFGVFENYQVFIETKGEYTRGMTVVDRRWNKTFIEGENCNQMAVCLSVDQKKYAELVVRIMVA
jgi:inosine-uridine nucleoside N-ribohydrolase